MAEAPDDQEDSILREAMAKVSPETNRKIGEEAQKAAERAQAMQAAPGLPTLNVWNLPDGTRYFSVEGKPGKEIYLTQDQDAALMAHGEALRQATDEGLPPVNGERAQAGGDDTHEMSGSEEGDGFFGAGSRNDPLTETLPRSLFEFSPTPENDIPGGEKTRIADFQRRINRDRRGEEETRVWRVGNRPLNGAGVAAQKFIDDFTSLTGTKVIFIDSTGNGLNFSGAVHSADANVILLHARGTRPIDALLGHEWGHTLQYQDKALYQPTVRKSS